MFGIRLIFYDPSRMLQLSEFVWTLLSLVWVVLNNFLLIDASDRSREIVSLHQVGVQRGLHATYIRLWRRMSDLCYLLTISLHLYHFLSCLTCINIVCVQICVIIRLQSRLLETHISFHLIFHRYPWFPPSFVSCSH